MTGREKMDAEDQRQRIFKRDDWKCLHCGQSIYTYGAPQLAHRIAATKGNLRKYGTKVIHHCKNMGSTCRVEPCNSALNIGFNPGAVEELVAEIREAIGRGEE